MPLDTRTWCGRQHQVLPAKYLLSLSFTARITLTTKINSVIVSTSSCALAYLGCTKLSLSGARRPPALAISTPSRIHHTFLIYRRCMYFSPEIYPRQTFFRRNFEEKGLITKFSGNDLKKKKHNKLKEKNINTKKYKIEIHVY